QLHDEPHGFRVSLRRPGMTNYLPIPEENAVIPAEAGIHGVGFPSQSTNPMDSGFGYAAPE
ncbi:MAG: hypothetical protein NT115_13780, partial [Proteobacteria bacterium]|nr:hypothetical protein [Pseudomonadota bacterium]